MRAVSPRDRMRRSTASAEVLKAALKQHFPIKVRFIVLPNRSTIDIQFPPQSLIEFASFLFYFLDLQIDKDEETVNAMANANRCMYGLTNCIYHGDCKNVYVAARSEESRPILKFHAVKMCIIICPTMVLAEYALGNG